MGADGTGKPAGEPSPGPGPGPGPGTPASPVMPAERLARLREQWVAEQRLRRLVTKDPAPIPTPAVEQADARVGVRAGECAPMAVLLGGRRLVNFGANDYLGLARHPAVLAGAHAALDAYGAGATGSRLLSGNQRIHEQLETALAALKHQPRALVFPSGYQAAVTLLATLAALYEAPPPMLLDRLCHASLIDGAKLAHSRVQRFKHNDPEDLDRYLARHAHAAAPCIVAVESVYSMDGDAAPLAELHAVCMRRHAVLVVDDAHATGVVGPAGAGLALECAGDPNVVVLGTLSKALGAQGGFVAGAEWVVEALIQTGRGFLFSTGLNPAAVGAALAAVRELPRLEAARAHLTALRERLLQGLATLGGDTRAGAGGNGAEAPLSLGSPPVAAIVPFWVGADGAALRLAERLAERGYYVPAVRPPTVPPGTARLRISLSAAHSPEEVDGLVAALTAVGA